MRIMTDKICDNNSVRSVFAFVLPCSFMFIFIFIFLSNLHTVYSKHYTLYFTSHTPHFTPHTSLHTLLTSTLRPSHLTSSLHTTLDSSKIHCHCHCYSTTTSSIYLYTPTLPLSFLSHLSPPVPNSQNTLPQTSTDTDRTIVYMQKKYKTKSATARKAYDRAR